MVVAGLVTLAIPIVGWHSISQLDDALDESRRAEQQLRVNNIVRSLSNNPAIAQQLNTRGAVTLTGELYAPAARYPVFIDGYADDWRELNAPLVHFRLGPSDSDAVMTSGSDQRSLMTARATVRDKKLFVLVNVVDDAVVFHQPPRQVLEFAEGEQPDLYAQLVNGDALEVLLQSPTGSATHGLFRVVAPGPMVARVASATTRRKLGATLGSWQGHWTPSTEGMQLEFSLPVPPDGSTLALAYVNVNERGEARNQWWGSLSPADMAERHASNLVDATDPKLRLSSESLSKQLERWVTPSTRARLFDVQGRLLADVNALYEVDERTVAFDPAKSNLWDALVYRLVSALLRERKGDYTQEPLYSRVDGLHIPASLLEDDGPWLKAIRYQTDESDWVLGSLKKVTTATEDAYLLFETNDSRASSYAGSRFAQLLSLLTLVSAVVGGTLLLFATVLSFRIRRLSQQASAAVTADGRVASFNASKASDEIGDLSRNLGALLGRTQHYTQYLEALSSRLSHELRTPLSVVKTSLENIETTPLDEQTQLLLRRAGGGADQLGQIIKALVESTRLEQTVQQAQKIPFDLASFLDGSQARYESIYPHIRFDLQSFRRSGWMRAGPDESVFGSPELLQQALDKLVDNAVSFTSDGVVVLNAIASVRREAPWVTIEVTNTGVLGANISEANVFDPMFSSRQHADGELHLGLGLYIVRMVAEAHGGRATVTEANGRVSFKIEMPRNAQQAEEIQSH
jgi:two-component system, OmpR family, sensor histidine kinase ChvG